MSYELHLLHDWNMQHSWERCVYATIAVNLSIRIVVICFNWCAHFFSWQKPTSLATTRFFPLFFSVLSCSGLLPPSMSLKLCVVFTLRVCKLNNVQYLFIYFRRALCCLFVVVAAVGVVRPAGVGAEREEGQIIHCRLSTFVMFNLRAYISVFTRKFLSHALFDYCRCVSSVLFNLCSQAHIPGTA